MLKVNGQAYVTNLKEVSPRLITGTVYSFEKVGEEFKTTEKDFTFDEILDVEYKLVLNSDLYNNTLAFSSDGWRSNTSKKPLISPYVYTL